MKHRFTLLGLLMLLCIGAFAAGQKRKVLIIGVDGTRADALDSANTPNIDRLIANGFFSLDSWHLDITISGPSWSSIMCGVYSPKHGVTNNTYSGSKYNNYPYFTTHAKSIKPNLRAIQYTEWIPMSANVYNDSWDQKLIGSDGISVQTGDEASRKVKNDTAIDIMFTYFDAVDLAGHSSGFNPNNPAYISAIEGVDVQIGKIMDSLQARPTYAQEDWLVLLTTDHGGTGTGHGGISYVERHIWWIAYSPRITKRQIPASADPGLYFLYTVNKTAQKAAPVQADIAVTALHHVIYGSGILPDTVSAWKLDGKSWLCEMGMGDSTECPKIAPTTGVEQQINMLDPKIIPNPSNTGNFTIWCEGENNQPVSMTVTDVNGKVIKQETATTIKHHLSLGTVAPGIYLLSLRSGSKSSMQRLIVE